MKKKSAKKKTPARKPKKDAAQIALAAVEKAIGGKLFNKRPVRRP